MVRVPSGVVEGRQVLSDDREVSGVCGPVGAEVIHYLTSNYPCDAREDQLRI